ncbi:MAG: septum formation protein Maf [Planctomycetes bacterium]|nr:septum formation protein Maf [Planctomycetota bacterium]
MRGTPDVGGLRVVLASASASRRRLLEEAGFRTEIIPSRVAELKGRGRSLVETVLENAQRKAAAVARVRPDAVVLAADTLIEWEGRLVGKPRSPGEALALLETMAGHTHRLATGICLRSKGCSRVRAVVSRVRVRALSRSAIERILRTYDPTSVAGGYTVRPAGDRLIESVQGSFTNVVGLPMEVVVPLLRRLPTGASAR